MTVVLPVVLPALLAGIAWVVSFRLWNRHAPSPKGHWGGALAFGLGFLAGYVALVSWPPLPPNSADQSLALATIPLMALALAESFAKPLTEPRWAARRWFRHVLRASCLGLWIWLQSDSLLEYRWGTLEAVAWIGGVTIMATVWCESVDRYSGNHAGPHVPAALWLVTSASSAALVLTGSALLGQLAGALAAILGAAIVLSIWSKGFELRLGAATMWVFLLLGILWQGVFYSELSLLSAACIVAAPLAVGVADLRFFRNHSTTQRVALRVAVLVIPLSIALASAYRYWAAAQVEEYVY